MGECNREIRSFDERIGCQVPFSNAKFDIIIRMIITDRLTCQTLNYIV